MTTATRKLSTLRTAATRREMVKAANAIRDQYRGACSKPEAPAELRKAAAMYDALGLSGMAAQCLQDAAELDA